MSETPAEPTPAQGEATEATTVEQLANDVDWKAKSREWERRAKDNKAAADKLAELEEAQKTAEQRAAERLAEAERRAVEFEAKATRAEVAAASGIPADVLAGPEDSTAEAMGAFADKIKALLTAGSGQGNVVPGEGRNPTPQGGAEHQAVRSLFGSS